MATQLCLLSTSAQHASLRSSKLGASSSSVLFSRCLEPKASPLSDRRQRWQLVWQSQQCTRNRNSIALQAARNPLEESIAKGDNVNVNLRSEAEAPWRSLRLVMFSFFCVSATVGAVIATVQVISSLRGAPDALPLNDIATSWAIDVGAIATFAFLLKRDLKARDKQVARLQREERLGALQIELASGKVLRLTQLRGFARVVLFAGTSEQVSQVLESAESFREDLVERGVILVTLPIFGDATYGSNSPVKLSKDDLRFRASAIRIGDWAEWFKQQLSASSKRSEEGLYVSLRIDGRVRGSGTGAPPFDRFVKQLAPVTEGSIWKGFLDGMDGRVN